jgi:hypothetical protein
MWNANRPGPESLFTSPEWNSEETLIEAGAAGHQRGEADFTDRWRRLATRESQELREHVDRLDHRQTDMLRYWG